MLLQNGRRWRTLAILGLLYGFYSTVACNSPTIRRKCLQGDCQNGTGNMVWFTASYRGTFLDGQPHGEGQMEWPDGRIYRGQWHHGQPHGHGHIQWPDGRIYTGQVKQGKPHGYGKLIYKDGHSLDGYFDKGYFKSR